jgi:hypothetical protein
MLLYLLPKGCDKQPLSAFPVLIPLTVRRLATPANISSSNTTKKSLLVARFSKLDDAI